MHRFFHLVVLLATVTMASLVSADDKPRTDTSDSWIIDPGPYQLGSDSQPKDVPHGKVTQHEWLQSEVFPGTKRYYSVYVPAQYDGTKAAALMVFQDGHAFEGGEFKVPIVFDNLIAAGDMPPTIAVMVDPGHRGELPDTRGWKPRPANRSVEYDTVNGDYAKFLMTEILPEVEKQYKISSDPKMRAICGNSSGGICAFGVAWHRPDAFSKVLSHIGSFVNIRGGHHYEAMVRKTDKKDIRILLQDGNRDLNNDHGNWPLANQELAKSLEYKGYDLRFVYGTEGHNGKHGGAIFPDSLRWLWRDWNGS